MNITTKTGDSGKTSLLSGERVFKDDLRVDAYGTLDELCSFMGLARSLAGDKRTKKIIEDIQSDLFTIGAEMAATSKYLNKLGQKIDGTYISRLEKLIQQWEGKKKFAAGCFYLPGESLISSSFDIARVIARRAERKAVSLKRKKILKNSDIIIYLNRLSDLLYLFARNYERKPRKK